MRPFQRGAFLLALKAERTIIPLAIAQEYTQSNPFGLHASSFDVSNWVVGDLRITDVVPATANIERYELHPPGIPSRFQLLDTVGYGAGFWTNLGGSRVATIRRGWGMPADAFFASGWLGQFVVVVPSGRVHGTALLFGFAV